jgi:hypothetical protein
VKLNQPFFWYYFVTPSEVVLVAPVSIAGGTVLIELVVSVLETKADV